MNFHINLKHTLKSLRILATITETSDDAAPMTPTTGFGGKYWGSFPPSHLKADLS